MLLYTYVMLENEKLNQLGGEGSISKAPEATAAAEVKPEVAPEVAPERPTENFNDQAIQAIPIAPVAPTQQEPVQVNLGQPDPIQDVLDDSQESVEIDERWVEAVDTIIENDKGKPYEEEEDSEKLQINYLAQRFGRKIEKDKD